MSHRPEVFISAASGDLRTSRKVAREALLTIGCVPVEQATFPPEATTVREMLRERLRKCDAVIHIAGRCYGSEPKEVDGGARRRSYTQLEYDIARELRKPVYVFVCGEGYQFDNHVEERPELRRLQQAHRAALAAGDDKYETLESPVELERRVLALQTRVEQLSRGLRRTRLWLAGISAAAVVAVAALTFGTYMIVSSFQKNTETQNRELAKKEEERDRKEEERDRRSRERDVAWEAQRKQIEELYALRKSGGGGDEAIKERAKSSGVPEEEIREALRSFVARTEGNPKAGAQDRKLAAAAREILGLEQEGRPGNEDAAEEEPDPRPSLTKEEESAEPARELVLLSPEELAARAKGAVFRVSGTGRVDGKERKTSGVGCLVGPDGLAIIALDAVVGADDVRAEWDGQGKGAKVELLAYRTDLGLALARVDVSGLPRKDKLASFEPGVADPEPGIPVWGVSAQPAVSLKAGRLRGMVLLSELPEKTGQALDFAPSSRWYTTDAAIVVGTACVPVVDQYGRLIGWGEPSEKAPEGGSLVRAVDAVSAMMAEAASDRARWSDLATEDVQEAIPRSLKPQWMLVVTSPSGDLSSALSMLRMGWDCPRCGTAGTEKVKVVDRPEKIANRPNGLPGFVRTPEVSHLEDRSCALCKGNKCAPVDDLYRDIGKVVRGLRKIRAEDARYPGLKQRADKEFGRMAATSLGGLASCNARARSIMSGEFKRDQVLVGVGRVSQKGEEGGRMVFSVSLEGGQVRLEGPVVFNADASDTALVAGILENGSPDSGASGWVIRGGVVFANRPDYLDKKK